MWPPLLPAPLRAPDTASTALAPLEPPQRKPPSPGAARQCLPKPEAGFLYVEIEVWGCRRGRCRIWIPRVRGGRSEPWKPVQHPAHLDQRTVARCVFQMSLPLKPPFARCPDVNLSITGFVHSVDIPAQFTSRIPKSGHGDLPSDVGPKGCLGKPGRQIQCRGKTRRARHNRSSRDWAIMTAAAKCRREDDDKGAKWQGKQHEQDGFENRMLHFPNRAALSCCRHGRRDLQRRPRKTLHGRGSYPTRPERTLWPEPTRHKAARTVDGRPAIRILFASPRQRPERQSFRPIGCFQAAPSSRGLGHGPFKAATRVRIPSGSSPYLARG